MQKKQKGIISNPNLAPYIKQSVLAYQEADILNKFYTGFCVDNSAQSWISFLPKKLRFFLNRRGFHELDPKKLRTNAWPEILRVLANRFTTEQLSDNLWEWAEKKFDRDVAEKIKQETAFFHGYEHACLNSLKRAKSLGIPTFYEQPSQHHAYFTGIVKDQLRKYPELASIATDLLDDEKAKWRNHRRDEELALADYVICNSTFTRNTLLAGNVDPKKLIVIPYGYPNVKRMQVKDGHILQFIYAGNLSLRKGIHLLLEAWRRLPADLPIRLTLVGSNQLPSAIIGHLPENVKWIPNLPYELAQKKIAESNVFVLPTLADGFGMVITESMALGVPVITTDASAGPDLIENYVDGICIKADDVAMLTKTLQWCIEHPNLCTEMGEKAQIKAAAYPWSAFRKNLVEAVKHRLHRED